MSFYAEPHGTDPPPSECPLFTPPHAGGHSPEPNGLWLAEFQRFAQPERGVEGYADGLEWRYSIDASKNKNGLQPWQEKKQLFEGALNWGNPLSSREQVAAPPPRVRPLARCWGTH
jgi:hypothetical protein